MTPPTGQLGFGAAQIGNLHAAVSDERSRDVLTAAWDSGIRTFDTAPHYGLGLSERRLGAFLREHPRGDFTISTKVGRLLVPNPDFAGGRDLEHGFDVPDDLVRRFDPSADGIRRSLDESLQRLGLDRVDILYLHDPDVYDLDRGLREGLPALAALRDEGLVSRIGVGVNDASVAARAVHEGDLDLVMIAGRYTLLDQSAADELLPLCASRGVRVVAAAVYNSGLLASSNPDESGLYDYRRVPTPMLARARELARVCEQFGVDLPTTALHFPLLAPQVDLVVVGSADPDSVRQNASRMSTPVPVGVWDALVAEGLLGGGTDGSAPNP